MAIARINIVTSVDPENSFGALDQGSETFNCVYDRYPSGATYATQRPGITIITEPQDFALPSIGRGIYYWAEVGNFYIVNYDQVEAGYGLNVGSISPGRDRVYFAELNDKLVIIDPENNEGWYIDAGAPTTLVAMADVDFPPNQTPARQLAGGVVTLNGYMFVMDTEGSIWNSAIGDATSWDALDFITAEREPDTGVFIAKHHDQIVAINSKSIEFFYDAANATGSPLSRRQDVSYRTGAVDRKAVYATGDIISLVGTEQSGTLGLYRIENFRLQKQSSMSIDESISFLGLRRGQDFIVSLAMINDHYITYVSSVLPQVDGSSRPIWEVQNTFVYDNVASLWSVYKTDVKDVGGFSVVDIADKEQGTDRTVTMLFSSGDVAELTNVLEPIDTVGDKQYFEIDDYIENQEDYTLTVGQDAQDSIEMVVTLGEFDAGRMPYKFGHSLWLVGDSVSNAQGNENIEVRWSDDHYNTFTPYREIDTGMRRKLTRLGKFRRRAHEIRYKGQDTVRIEGIEINIGAAQYA